eukprot:c11180_g1_i1 orf=467-1933(-)
MDTDQGKLFIGGISWETTEEKLKDYFQAFGEVIEAVIMKDRATGRARGFGFVVFADPSVADVVVLDKHIIDGRSVEAKKAVPREEQQSVNRNNNGNGGGHSPSLVARTKKIFVGGLASTVTESDFRMYFEQFGAITDVVVMYDHGTQRPRGFGFITFDSEDAVDRVLQKTFHELNDKMVEVKRAIPKDLSASPIRNMGAGLGASPHRGSPYGVGYAQAFNSSPGSPYGGFRMDSRYGSPLGSRGTYSPSYGAMAYGSSGNYGGLTNGTYGAGTYGGGGPYSGTSYGGSSSGGGGGYGGIGAGSGSNNASSAYGSPSGRNVWGSGGAAYGNISNSAGFGGNGGPSPGSYGGAGTWGSSQASGISNSAYGNYRYGYGGGDGAFMSSVSPSHAGQTSGYGNFGGVFGASRTGSGPGSNSFFGDIYGSSGYGDSTWRTTPADTLKAVRTGAEGLGSAVYSLNSSINGSAEDIPTNNEVYGVSGRQPYKGVAV